MKLQNGFYPALGTPLDSDGNFIEESMRIQVELMSVAGASGYLALGSMGQQPCVKDSEIPAVARSVVAAAGGNAPVFVGCMDNSLARIRARFDALKGVKIDGVVLTTPYYFTSSDNDLALFFTKVCEMSPFPVYLYDLPGVTKQKITYSLVTKLMYLPNLAGIKGGDPILMRDLLSRGDIKDSFNLLFSGLDIFDIAYSYGLTKQLDGMFCCVPKLTKRLYAALASGDKAGSAKALNDLVDMRDFLLSMEIFQAFTAAMNTLGCAGSFHPDYFVEIDGETVEKVAAKMVEIGEITV